MDNLAEIIRAIARGVIDSFKGFVIVFTLDKETEQKIKQNAQRNDGTRKRKQETEGDVKLVKRVFQCCALNAGVYWTVYLGYHFLLVPFLKYFYYLCGYTGSFSLNVSEFLFYGCWNFPFILICKVINSIWCLDIANYAYKYSMGKPQSLSSVGKQVSDFLFSSLIEFIFLVQAVLVSYFPVYPFGLILALIHNCFLYSLYAFEYKMCNMGWELHKRLNFIEANWPYFIGFGLPLSICTTLPSSYIVCGSIYAVWFPFSIISAIGAAPVTNVTSRRLQLFSPVITLSNVLIQKATLVLLARKSAISN